MEKLYSQRRNQHFLMLLKYWRLVFNDHFVIALFVMLGAVMWGYSQGLEQLTTHTWWSKPLAIVIALVIVQIGRLATLVKAPDPIFLLPQAKMIDRYLRKAFWHSLILAELITIALTLVMLPFIMVTTNYATWQAGLILVVMVELKAGIMNWQLDGLYYQYIQPSKQTFLKLALPVIIVAIGFWLNWILAVTLSTIFLIGLHVHRLRSSLGVLNWQTAVKQEEQRMLGVYRFFNLFTDVPMVQGIVHRRRYLDGVVNLLSNSQRPFSFLYVRGLLRGTEVSGLLIRLTVVGMAILFFIPMFWLNLVIMVLFVYLLTIQLIPFYWHFDSHVFTHLYPVKLADQVNDFKSLTTKVLMAAMVFLWLASSGTQLNLTQLAIKLVVGIVEVELLTHGYVMYRIKQKNK